MHQHGSKYFVSRPLPLTLRVERSEQCHVAYQIKGNHEFSSMVATGFYTKLNVWGSLGLNFEYDGGPIIEIGGPIYLCKLRILEGSTGGSTSFREVSVLSPGQ